MNFWFLLLHAVSLAYGYSDFLNEDDNVLDDWTTVKNVSEQLIVDVLVVTDILLMTYPLNIKFGVSTVMPQRGYNTSLDDFRTWYNDQQYLYMSDRFLLNAKLFVHGFAHLAGLKHEERTKCTCGKIAAGKCLRIRGFQECSVQHLSDRLRTKKCLYKPEEERRPDVEVCGNGLVEGEEQCDCGPERYCDNLFCQPNTCTFVLDRKLLYTTVVFTFALILCVVFIWILKILSYIFRYTKKRTFTTKNDRESQPMNCLNSGKIRASNLRINEIIHEQSIDVDVIMTPACSNSIRNQIYF